MAYGWASPVLVVLGIWVACVTTETGGVETTVGLVPSVVESGTEGTADWAATENQDLKSAVAMMDVTPQIPDGPVVQAFQRLVGKQKLDAEIARQKKLMGPLLDRGDAKVQAKKKELSMLAEVEIKNRLGKRELALKRKDKEDNRAEHARQEAAKARRLERYEKWSQDEVKRNQERLGKLHSHTSTAFDMAKQLFKRAPSSKKSAVESMAKASAKQRQELTVGGFLGLKGDQINFDALSDLNDKIAKAMQVPDDGNINFVEAAYDKAATAVAEEQASFKRKEGSWKEKANKVQEEKEKEQIQKHNGKLDELRTKVQKEQTVKANRKDKIETDRLANEQAEKGRWRAAFEDIKKKRQAISDGEATEKNKFHYTLGVKEVAKKNKAPGEMATAKAKKLTEREEKYNGQKNADAATAYVAKQMRKRACEEYVHALNTAETYEAKPPPACPDKVDCDTLNEQASSGGRRLLTGVFATPTSQAQQIVCNGYRL